MSPGSARSAQPWGSCGDIIAPWRGATALREGGFHLNGFDMVNLAMAPRHVATCHPLQKPLGFLGLRRLAPDPELSQFRPAGAQDRRQKATTTACAEGTIDNSPELGRSSTLGDCRNF